jgi:hypothetical protein
MDGGARRLGLVLLVAFGVGAVGILFGSIFEWAAGARFAPWTSYISELSVGPPGAQAVFVVMILAFAGLTGWFFSAAPERLGARSGNGGTEGSGGPGSSPGTSGTEGSGRRGSSAGVPGREEYRDSAIVAPPAAAKLGRVFGLVSATALVVMVFVPLDRDRPACFTAHLVTAVIVFFCMSGAMTVYGFALRGKTAMARLARIIAFPCAVSAFAFAVLTVLVEIAGVIPQSPLVYLTEWISFGLFALWMLAAGIRLRWPAEQTWIPKEPG